MRSLFAKVLGWFALAILITVIATVLTSVFSYDPNLPVRAPFSLLLGKEALDARHAWETGGRDALAAELNTFLGVTGARGVRFTDANGTDLATGEPHPELTKAAREHPRFPVFGRDGLIFARFSRDGRYCFFLITSPNRLIFSNLQPAHLLVVLIAVLLCYALTYHLTAPLRGQRDALERFGRGDLDARAEESRRDEFGELARAFNRMATRIQTLLSAERRLLLDVSHELRSPLARLSVAIELARSSESAASPLDRIQKEADRLNELISHMLEVTRLENDPTQRRVEHVQLDRLVSGLVDDCSIEAQARDCALAFNPPPRVTVDGDGELLRRAIENVIRNAIRYSPPKSSVEIGLDNGGGRARVRVRDYGPGVPESSLARLFDPFYRVEPDRNRGTGGVGLGLSIARRAVELHRGTLKASNATPGLLVEIELPV